MTNSNSTYPQEWIAQDSIPMQSELAKQWTAYKAEESQKNYLFISFDGTQYTCREVINTVRGYFKAIETLNWIANCKPIIECGYPDILQRARETLEEIENDRQS